MGSWRPDLHTDGAEQAKPLYSKLGYPSVKDFKWIFQSLQIIDCPVTVQNIDITHTIRGNTIVVLKGRTTKNKPIDLSGDIVEISNDIV